MDQLRVHGVDLKFRRYGNPGNPTVVLIHGFGGGPADWQDVVDLLKNQYHVIVPNITPFFTSSQPVGFSRQVFLLAELLKAILPRGEGGHLVGISYGGLLSWAARFYLGHRVVSHTLVNPMPPRPLQFIRNPMFRAAFVVSRIPWGVHLIGGTSWGQKIVRRLSNIFRMGLRGHDPLRIFNARKLKLIEKALRRFLWIVSTEDWSQWESRSLPPEAPALLLYSTQDRIFSGEQYQKFSNLLSQCEQKPIPQGGHLIIKTKPDLVVSELIRHMEKSLREYKAG